MPPLTRRKKAAIADLPPAIKAETAATEHPPDLIHSNSDAGIKPKPRVTRSTKPKEVEPKDKVTKETIDVNYPALTTLDKDVEQEAVDLQLQAEIGKGNTNETRLAQSVGGLSQDARTLENTGSVEVKDAASGGQLLQCEDYLKDLRGKNVISVEQMGEMLKADGTRKGVSQEKEDTEDRRVITPSHVEQFNEYLADLERRRITSRTQAVSLKHAGLETSYAKSAAQQGVFEQRRRSSAEIGIHNRFLQEYLEDLVTKGFVTRRQTNLMKLIGVGSPDGEDVSTEPGNPKDSVKNDSMNNAENIVLPQECTSQQKTAQDPAQVLSDTLLKARLDRLQSNTINAAPNPAKAILQQQPERQKTNTMAGAPVLVTDVLKQQIERGTTNNEIYEEIEALQVLQYEAFVDELSARGYISLDQLDPLKRCAFRGYRTQTASQQGVFIKAEKPNPDAELYFKEFLSTLRSATLLTPNQWLDLEGGGLRGLWAKPIVRESPSVGQARQFIRTKRQEHIEVLEYTVYEHYLRNLQTKGIISAAQAEKLKSHGLIHFVKHAIRQGCFKGVDEELNPRVEKAYELMLESYFHRGLLDGPLLAKLRQIGLRGLEIKCSSSDKPSKLAPPNSRAANMQQRSQYEYPRDFSYPSILPRPPVYTSASISSQLTQQYGPRQGNVVEQRQRELPLTVRSTLPQPAHQAPLTAKSITPWIPDMRLLPKLSKENERTESSNHNGHSKTLPGSSSTSTQQHDSTRWGQAIVDQMKLEEERKRQVRNTQKIDVDLIQQKAQNQEEMMKNWSQRETEVAAYKEKRRQAKELAKLERQTRKERDIVSSAIDAVVAEMSNKPAPSFIEDDEMESTLTPAETPKPAPKTNAFSMMMKAPSNTKIKASQWRQAPLDFSHYIPNFEKSLESIDCQSVGEKEWAKVVGKKIAACVQADIISQTHERCNVQTRINAMNAILEIATAVAYTPGAVADRVRAGHTPNYLIASLYMIAEKFSEPEAKRMLKERWFLETLKQLRTDPGIPWEGDTWNGLDDVLRVLKDSGPVDFRRIFRTIKERLEEGSKSASSPIIKAIRREISDYVTHDSCFETKYNALNVLADISTGLLQGSLPYPRKDAKVVVEALCEALLKLSQSLKVYEIEQIVEEFRMDEGIPDARFSNALDQLLIPDTTKSIYRQQYENCRTERDIVDRLLKERSTKRSSEYCDTSLLMKLYYIKWQTFKLSEDWESSKGKLLIILETLVDTSTPIEAGEYLGKLQKNFAQELAGPIPNDGFGTLRESVDRTIHQISKRSSSKASYISRANAFRILTKIGLLLVGWLDPTKPFWQTRIFKDQMTEDSLTDAMRMVCHSLVKDDRAKLLADAELITDLTALNTQRLQLSEAMLGLDSTMNLINGTDGDSRRRAMPGMKRKIAEFDDLTLGSDDERQPQKKHAISKAPAKVITMIDLTDD